MDSIICVSLACAFILCLIALLTLWLKACGLLSEIIISAGHPPFGELTIAYKFAKGRYKTARDLIKEVTTLVPHLQRIGIYYNDVKHVPTNHLGYAVGAILSRGLQLVSEHDKQLLIAHGYKLFKIPAVTHMVLTTFPYTGSLSLFIAVLRVYPKLAAYIEIFSPGKIQFLAPLSQQDEFYVPETQIGTDVEELESHRSATDSDSLQGSEDLRSADEEFASRALDTPTKDEESNGSTFEVVELADLTSQINRNE